MSGKEQIVEELGELLLPNLVNKGLVANDRAKYLMTLLQSAREHAHRRDCGFTEFRSERIACGIEQPAFDTVVEQCTLRPTVYIGYPNCTTFKNSWWIISTPCWHRFKHTANRTTRAMESAADFRRRLDALTAAAPAARRRLDLRRVHRPDHVRPTGSGDSVHLLVMHLHKELNRVQQHIAAESIDGAHVYGVTDADRVLDRRLHARSQPHAAAEVRSPGARHDGHANARQARDPERHWHDRRACTGDPRHAPSGNRDLHGRAHSAVSLLPEPAQTVQRGLGRHAIATVDATGGESVSRVRGTVHGRRPRPIGRLSGASRFAPGVLDRLESRTEAICANSRPNAFAWTCCSGRRTTTWDTWRS